VDQKHEHAGAAAFVYIAACDMALTIWRSVQCSCRNKQAEDLLSSMPPSMLVQPSMAMRSSTDRAVADDTQQPCANPAAMPAAAASVLLASSTELSAAA